MILFIIPIAIAAFVGVLNYVLFTYGYEHSWRSNLLVFLRKSIIAAPFVLFLISLSVVSQLELGNSRFFEAIPAYFDVKVMGESYHASYLEKNHVYGTKEGYYIANENITEYELNKMVGEQSSQYILNEAAYLGSKLNDEYYYLIDSEYKTECGLLHVMPKQGYKLCQVMFYLH